MGGRSGEGSSSTSSKRRRREWDCDCDCAARSRPRRKQHLYLALDDSTGGYSIYKLDADDISDDSGRGGERELPGPAAIRMNSPACGPMDFAALAAGIFAAPDPRYYHSGDRDYAPPTIVYNTWTAAVAAAPPLPSGVPALGAAMAAGGKLYALTNQVLSLQALSSWAPIDDRLSDQERDWIWNTVPSPPPCSGLDVVAYALHPDGRTKRLGDWGRRGGRWGPGWCHSKARHTSTPTSWTRGSGSITRRKEGYVCCCPVASRGAPARVPPQQ
uniref:Uncharacterized protein n=1 Tax=Aegilops tauschii TaxID=37682 RepID=M8BKJ3_AEGTA